MHNILEIYTEEMPPGWEWSRDSYLGGTPEFVINTAENAPFEEVFVYYDGKAMEVNGVYYLPRKMYRGVGVLLACNSIPERLCSYNIYWSNWHHQRQDNAMMFNERIVISPYHQSIFGENSRIVPHSCNVHEFSNPIKTKNKCLYSSSPDRGGEFIKSIWDNVSRETGAELVCTYDNRITEEEMIEHYKSSQFWLHPGQGIELFCIAAAKAQVAKCIPVVVPNMALDTTVKFGVRTTLERYKEDLIEAIKNPPKTQDVDFGSWKSVTEEMFKYVS